MLVEGLAGCGLVLQSRQSAKPSQRLEVVVRSGALSHGECFMKMKKFLQCQIESRVDMRQHAEWQVSKARSRAGSILITAPGLVRDIKRLRGDLLSGKMVER